jgi:type IV secretory pathway VirB2 component (pilin)
MDDPTVAEILTSVTGAMTDIVSASVIATIAIAGISLAMAWGGLRRVLRIGGR